MNLFAALVAAFLLQAQPLPVIPAPVQVSERDGSPKCDKELSCRIGQPDFARRTADIPGWAQEEAYLLEVTPRGYRIQANTATGRLRALQTLAQVDRCCTIYDYPRFPYRGFMLDISRHFRDKDFIIKQMEALSSVKLNRLHLHLTDDAGWRLQIERYPLLGSQAAWRVGREWRTWYDGDKLYATEGDEKAYGGYLTQSDVREIVAAGERLGMVVVPEIEMPGHSREVMAAYPELGCFPGSEEFCPGKEATFTFLENVLDEVMALFPSEYIHIGGDEASKRDWPGCPDCQARMQAEGLDSVEALQSYLVRRIERYLNAHGRKLVGWDEILEGGLSPNATVMSWRGTEGGIEAMRQGHDAIMAPQPYCYINGPQDAPIYEPPYQGPYLPVDKVYGFDPAQGIDTQLFPHLLGVQACLWHEMIVEPDHTEYMMYPRVAAVAETGWSPASAKDLASFRERAARWTDGLAGRNYRVFDLRHEKGVRPEAREPILHKGRGACVTYATPWSPKYAAAGAETLTDGLRGDWSYQDGRWQGFLSDVDVTLDLGQAEDLHYVGVSLLSQPGPWIYLPTHVEFSFSDDGEHFTDPVVVRNQSETPVVCYLTMGTPVSLRARYVRVQAFRLKEWLFIDEILVN